MLAVGHVLWWTYVNRSGPAAGRFCHRVNSQLGTGASTAGWDASAVLSTVAEAISGGELNQLLSVLPSGYAALFGKPELGQ